MSEADGHHRLTQFRSVVTTTEKRGCTKNRRESELDFKSKTWTFEPKRGVEWMIQKAGFAGACPKADLPFQHHLQIPRHLARFTAAD